MKIEGTLHPAFDEVKDAFKENFEKRDEVGASIAVVRKGEVLVHLWAGYQNEKEKILWKENTVVNAFSVGKGVMAILIGILVDEGLLEYGKKIAYYWPEFGANGKQDITLEQVLSHESGLPYWKDRLRVEDYYDWDGMIHRVEKMEPIFSPGEQVAYHPVSWGYIIGEVIRRVCGKDARAVLKEKLTDPLSLDVHIGMPEKDAGRVAFLTQGKEKFADKKNFGGNNEAFQHYVSAFCNPMLSFERDILSQAWRDAEMCALNCHGDALSFAKLYASLLADTIPAITGRSGRVIEMLMQQSAVSAAQKDIILGRHSPKGRGILLNSARMFGPNQEVFGHTGVGGTVAFADIKCSVGISYIMNRLCWSNTLDARGRALIDATFRCLSRYE